MLLLPTSVSASVSLSPILGKDVLTTPRAWRMLREKYVRATFHAKYIMRTVDLGGGVQIVD